MVCIQQIKTMEPYFRQFLKLLLLIMAVCAAPYFSAAQTELSQSAVSNGAGVVSGGNYTGYVSVGQMSTYMYANGSYIATSGIILNEISGDAEFTFDLTGNLTGNDEVKSGQLSLKSGAELFEGAPLAFTKVYLLDTDSAQVLFETETNETGYFSFKNIPYQDFYLVVKKPEISGEEQALLLTFESNIFINEVEINVEVGTEGLSAEIQIIPYNNADTANTEYAIWYQDFDGDGFGNPFFLVEQHTQPVGYVSDNTDCNDQNPDFYPGAPEVEGSGTDTNCDGLIVGIDEIPNKFSVEIYPNPTKGLFNLRIINNNSPEIKVVVVNTFGQKILEKDYRYTDKTEINLSGNTPGLYFVNVYTAEQLITKRVIFQ